MAIGCGGACGRAGGKLPCRIRRNMIRNAYWSLALAVRSGTFDIRQIFFRSAEKSFLRGAVRTPKGAEKCDGSFVFYALGKGVILARFARRDNKPDYQHKENNTP